MAKTKISTLNLRIEPGLKEAVRQAAAREHRSVANMIEMLIRRHCDQSGITARNVGHKELTLSPPQLCHMRFLCHEVAEACSLAPMLPANRFVGEVATLMPRAGSTSKHSLGCSEP